MDTILRDDVAQEVDSRGSGPGLIRLELQSVEAETCEEGSYSRYVIDGVLFRSDCTIKIHPNVVEAGHNESHNGDEPGGSTGGALGHAQPFVESVEGAERSQGGSIRVRG